MSIDAPPPHLVQVPRLETKPDFVGTKGEFRRIVIRGALLELVTFGFYRFWLATKMRRHLWSNTLIDGEPLEYMGTARELLIGFLFALAILVPIYFLYFLAGVEAERAKAFASLPLFAFLLAFRQFAIYRARRYRLTRTMWRGVRFWMEGSGLGYAWRACLWNLLTYLTLGLALPWSEAALERYKMRRTYYGDLRGEFASTGWQLFKRGWWLWSLAVLVIVLVIVTMVVLASFAAAASSQPALNSNLEIIAAEIFGLAFLVTLPTAPFFYAAYKAIEWRWWASGLRFGKLAISSDLKRRSLFGNYWATVGWSWLLFALLLVALFTITFLMAHGREAGEWEKLFSHLGRGEPVGLVLLGAYAACYVATLLAIGAVIRIYLLRGVWQKIVASLTITDIAAADNVTARGEAVNALGEGFADSLDIAGF